MKNLTHCSSAVRWLWACLFAILLAACGGGGGGGNDVLLASSNTAPGAAATTVPGTVAPGTVAPGTVAPATNKAPTVPSSSPGNAATNVAVSTVGPDNSLQPKSISATFSEPMNPATLVSPAATFTVKETTSGHGVAGNVSVDKTNTVATFTPTAPLAPNTQFTATITPAATNPAGTPLANNTVWTFTTGSQVGQAPIDLKTAARFLVLGGNSIDNISTAANPTRINGQLGIAPGNLANVTGFTDSAVAGTGIILTSGIQLGSTVNQAKTDLQAALALANVRTSHQVDVGTSELASFSVNGGSPGVYPPGLYTSSASLTLNAGQLTLDARGDPDAVWVFKGASNLVVGNAGQIVLLNGAKARNVFWTLGSSALIGDQVSFKGSILAGTSIAVGTASGTGTTVEGRVLAISALNVNFTTVTAP